MFLNILIFFIHNVLHTLDKRVYICMYIYIYIYIYICMYIYCIYVS